MKQLAVLFLLVSSVSASSLEDQLFDVPYLDHFDHELGPRYFRSSLFHPDDDEVELQVIVDKAGNVESARALHGPRKLFRDVEALVRNTRFKPFLHDGKPVRARFRYEVVVVPPENWLIPRVPFPDVRDWKSFRAKLERRTCHNKDICFWYSVEVHGDGSVEYEGSRWQALITGHHHDHIPQSAVQTLLNEFRKADYFSLRDSYRLETVHGLGASTSISFDGRTKIVDDFQGDHVGAPDVLPILENAFDRIAETGKWVVGNSATVRSLQKEGWDSRTENEDNENLYFRSFEHGPKELFDFLLQQQPLSPERRACALGAAAARGDLAFFQRVVKMGVNPKDSICVLSGEVALMRAMESGQPDIVRLILSYHPDVNRKGRQGDTALMTYLGRLPYRPGQPQANETVIDLLLRAGADVNTRDRFGQTPFFFACSQSLAVFDKLVKAGADINARDHEGHTPVMACNDTAGLQRLLALGPDLRARDDKGLTALEQAREAHNSIKFVLLQYALRTGSGKILPHSDH